MVPIRRVNGVAAPACRAASQITGPGRGARCQEEPLSEASSHVYRRLREWPLAWRITRLTTCLPRPALRRQEFPKQSIWRSEGCWATPQSTTRTA